MESRRETPTYFALWNKNRTQTPTSFENSDWAFGSKAREICFRNPSCCVQGRIIDRDTRGLLKGYEITAISLYDFVNSVRIGEQINDSVKVVLAIPPGLTTEQKTLLYTACSLADVKVKGFVDSTVSVAHMYALERSGFFVNEPLNVLFVDVGSGGMSASVTRFETKDGQTMYTQLAATWNNSVGGDTLDEDLTQLVAAENQLDITHEKAKFKLKQDILKAKELLTLHPKREMFIEEPFRRLVITREMLAECSNTFNTALNSIIKKVLEEANVTIDSVELIGSVTRAQFVGDIIASYVPGVRLARSLNSETAVAMGAGYIAATFSSHYIVKSVTQRALTKHACDIRTGNTTISLFTPSDKLRTVSTVNATVDNNQEFMVTCDNTPTFRFKTTKIERNSSINVSFVHSNYLIPVIANVSDGEVVRLSLASDIKPTDYNEARDHIDYLVRSMQLGRRFQEVRSNFEAYMIELENFEREQTELVPDERAMIKESVESMRKILDGATTEDSIEVLIQNSANINATVWPIQDRIYEITKKPLIIEKMRKQLTRAQELKDNVPDVSETSMDMYQDFVREMNLWFSQVEQGKLSVHRSEIIENRKQLKKKIKELLAEQEVEAGKKKNRQESVENDEQEEDFV